MALDADLIATELAARGLRLTRQRRAVVDAVAASNACLSPLEVFHAARGGCPDLGLTTVYRTLELLDEIGALRRIHGPDGCERLVRASAAHGHSVVCGACGRVTEFTECDMTEVVEAARRETGYRITEHFLQLDGVCADCTATAERTAAAEDAAAAGRKQGRGDTRGER
jgi:Fur family ferric uptake transcriptional regulator